MAKPSQSNPNDAVLTNIWVNEYRGQLLGNQKDFGYVYYQQRTIVITSQDIKVKDIESILIKQLGFKKENVHSFRRTLDSKPLSPEAIIKAKDTILFFRIL